MHILNKDSIRQRYFTKTRIVEGITILNLSVKIMPEYRLELDQ